MHFVKKILSKASWFNEFMKLYVRNACYKFPIIFHMFNQKSFLHCQTQCPKSCIAGLIKNHSQKRSKLEMKNWFRKKRMLFNLLSKNRIV